jgi:hypothetical protein
LVQKEWKKPFMKNFRSLETSGHRVRDDLASGNFGLGKKIRVLEPKAQNTTPTPLVCGHPQCAFRLFPPLYCSKHWLPPITCPYFL